MKRQTDHLPGAKRANRDQISLAAMIRMLLVTLLVVFPVAVEAQDSTEELRRIARNPLSDAVQVPFVADTYFNAGPYDRTPSSLQTQPVIPLHLSQKFDLITRLVTTAFAYVPAATNPSGGDAGLGDTIMTFFLTPANPGKLIWGIGPAVLAPTSTSGKIGGGNWDLGPSLALITERQWGSAGVLVQKLWSLPGRSNRVSVNQIQIETNFSYNLAQGWYLLTAPTLNVDLKQSAGERWVTPLGGGVGRDFNIGRQGVDANVALYYNAIRPNGENYPEWQLSLQLSLIYPKKQRSLSR